MKGVKVCGINVREVDNTSMNFQLNRSTVVEKKNITYLHMVRNDSTTCQLVYLRAGLHEQ